MSSHRRPPRVSLIVPFRPEQSMAHRMRLWEWLERYWGWELPDAEIVMADSTGPVFSKSEAVNHAAAKAKGRIFVILDSDCYIEGDVIKHCANEIDHALRRGNKLWFVPYRHLYRLTKEATEDVLESDPRWPLRFHSPPPGEEVGGTEGSMHGQRFGAMIQIMPREGFYTVGGMDPRFAGWGGEDVAFVRAMDTLYNRHKTTDNDVLHLWHARIGENFKDRMWEGQIRPRVNEHLAIQYSRAAGDRVKMRRLVDEGLDQLAEPPPTWTQYLLRRLRYAWHLFVWLNR